MTNLQTDPSQNRPSSPSLPQLQSKVRSYSSASVSRKQILNALSAVCGQGGSLFGGWGMRNNRPRWKDRVTRKRGYGLNANRGGGNWKIRNKRTKVGLERRGLGKVNRIGRVSRFSVALFCSAMRETELAGVNECYKRSFDEFRRIGTFREHPSYVRTIQNTAATIPFREWWRVINSNIGRSWWLERV